MCKHGIQVGVTCYGNDEVFINLRYNKKKKYLMLYSKLIKTFILIRFFFSTDPHHKNDG